MAKARKQLRECCQQGDGMAVDPKRPVLTGVKVLGLESANGRRYLPEAVSAALSLYEGVKVNVNHPEGNPNGSRGLLDRFGRLSNVRVEGDCLRGDLKYNPKHPAAEAVAWWAENDPGAIGLSHNAVGSGESDKDGVFVVEKIVAVRSVDLVADPATTKGLYESHLMDPDLTGPAPGEDEAGWEAKLGHLVAEILKDGTLDAAAKKKKLLTALKLLDDDKPAPSPPGEGEEDEDVGDKKKDSEESVKLSRKLAEKDRLLTEQRRKLDAYEAAERLSANRARAKTLCEASGLPATLVTDVFLDQLAEAASEAKMKALIQDRRALVGRRPVSSPPGGKGGTMSDDEFLAVLNGEKE